MLLFVLLYLTVQHQQTPIQLGKDSNKNDCVKGVVDCRTNQLLCEFGYFLFTDNNSLNYCLPCPYFLTQDEFNILCADCLENPYNWQINRECTYNYRIQTGDKSDVYLRENITTQVYYIQEKTTFQYQLVLCEGCGKLCNIDIIPIQSTQVDEIDEANQDEGNNADEGNQDEGNNQDEGSICLSNQQMDLFYTGMYCQDYFYYNQDNGQCFGCPLHCKQCDVDSKCSACSDGYYVDLSKSCKQCMENCEKCELYEQDDDEQILICTQCMRSNNVYYIESQDLLKCQECDYQCKRCELVYYGDDYIDYGTRDKNFDEDLDYISRCRQCLSKEQFISYNGMQCEECQIKDCQLCYYEFDDGSTTLDYDFIPQETAEGVFCKICKPGFYLSEDYKECNEITDDTDCGSYYEGDEDVNLCTNCYQNQILKIEEQKCNNKKKCSQRIKNCLECYVYNKQIGGATQQNYQCIKCEEGFYPDIFSGNCLNCPLNCITCWQYTMSYNFTSYLQTYPILTETEHYANFILEQLEDIQCSECIFGYMLQNNVCYGCSANCFYEDSDYNQIYSCYQDYDSMFCYRCQDKGSQSLISDLSECQECPDYCAACRDRTSEDPIVNRYFNPSSDRLNKYGRLCYKLYKPSPNLNVFLDSYLGLPVVCSNPQFKFCYNTYKLQLQLDCEDDGDGLIKLNQFYSKQKTSIVIIKFNEDSISNYQLLNQNTIQQLDIELTMLGDTCKFKKQTIFQFSFTQNVFSLLKVNLNIINDPSNMQEWQTVGLIQFKGVTSVQLNNINLKYDGTNPKLATGQFGFQLLSQDETELYLKKVNFIKQPDNKLLINIYNPVNITLDTVIFKNLNKNDQVIYCFYNLQTLSYQDIKILNVQIEDSYYNNSNFIQISTGRAAFQYLKISNLFIKNSLFNSSSLVKSIGQQSSLYFDIENLRILFSKFQICDIFKIDNLRISQSFNKIDFKNNRFINSRIFYLNSFQFQNIYFDSNVLTNNSIIFTSIKEMKENIQLQNSIKSYSFNNIKILHSNCYSINCIMYINTPINTYQILTSININNMEISNVGVSDIYDFQILATSAYLYLNNLQDIKLSNIIVDNTMGLTIFYLSAFSSLQITKIYYDWSQNNKWNNNINPINNLIPLTYECAQRKQQYSSFTYILVFIYQFKNIQITDGQLQRQLLIDATFFYIQSYDVAYFNTTTSTSVESIKIDNIRFLNNSFVSKEKGLISGCIYIQSNQQQKVSITNINFQSNHLQQVISKQSVQIAVLININSPKGIIKINNLLSNYNRAVNCLQGLIVVISLSLNISNCTFTYTNMIDRLWINRLEPNSIKSDDDIKSFFPILSYGTIFDITTYDANISQLLVNHTYGIQQGIKLLLIDYSNVMINNIIMENLYGNLELKYSSTGGAFYIDSKLSELTLTITNLSITNSRVRTTGGCIHLEADNKNQNITIIKSIFQKCQALDTSFINVVFDVNSQFQQIKLIQVQMIQNSIDLLLSNLPEVQTFEYLYLLQTSTFYKQFFGRLIIQNCDIAFVNYTSALFLNKINFLSIDRLNIEHGILFYPPLINLQLQESGAQVYIGNLDIIEFIESFYYSEKSNVTCEVVKSFIHQYPIQDCQQLQQIQEYYDEINDDEIYDEFNEDIFKDYELLTNKYTIKIIQNIKYIIQSSLIEISIEIDYNIVQCLMNNIIYLSNQLGIPSYISLFYLDSVNEYNQISIKQSSIAQITCYQCEDGLFLIFGIQDFNYEHISINEFSCSYNVIGYFGCLSLSFFNKYDIELFTDINYNRLLQTIDDLPHTIFIQNFQCDNNIALAGTCINIYGVSTIIKDSRFTNNYAKLVGGAVYFFKKRDENNLFMQNNLFSNNYAQIGGAIYLVNYQLNDVDKAGVYFDKNIADNSGNDIQEDSLSLTIQLTDIPFQINTYMDLDGDYNNDSFVDNSSVILRDNITLEYNKIGNYPEKTNLLILPSGQMISQYKYFYEQTQEQVPFQWIFRILSLNRYGQVIKNDLPSDSCDINGRIQNQNEYDDTIEFTNNFTIPQTIYYNYDKGGYDMDDLILIFDPKFDKDYYLELRFYCSKIQIPIYNTKPPYQIIEYNYNYELITRIRTFPCQIGESYEAQQCKACKQSDQTYSVQYDSIQCKQINRQSMQTVSPTGIRLYKGYWRPDYHNDNVEYCVNLPKNCNGGWVPGNPSCYTGHVGGLCESCDIYMIINDERWAPSGAYKCGLCKESEKYNIAIIVAISILTMISTILSIKGTFESLQLQIVLDIIQMLGRRMKSDSSNLATVVKTLTNYFQIVQIVMTFQLQIPSGVKTATETAGNPTGSMAYSLDCLLIKVSDIEVLYFKMIWALIMPLCYLGFIFIGYIFICLIGITKFSSSILYTACIYIFLYMHPTLVQGFISQASIRTISNLQFVKADVGYRYDSDLHSYWMSRFIGPMLIIWVIALPALFMFLVWLNRKTLHSKQTKMRWGYFYREYGNDSYLWEFVKIFQKEFLVIILVYYEEFVIIKGLLIVLVLFIYGWNQVSVSPFQSKKLNTTDRYSTMVCAATLCLGVLMYGAQQKDYFYLLVIILLIMAFINIWFIIQCLMQIFQGYLIQFQDQLDLLREKIIKSKPHLKEKKGFIGKLLIHRGNLNKRVKFLWELCKERTITAVHITKLADDISFEEALSYVILNNINSTQIISIQKNKKGFEKLHSNENE